MLETVPFNVIVIGPIITLLLEFLLLLLESNRVVWDPLSRHSAKGSKDYIVLAELLQAFGLGWTMIETDRKIALCLCFDFFLPLLEQSCMSGSMLAPAGPEPVNALTEWS